jgi:hypothetical protein
MLPLYLYAMRYWGHHARKADTDCDEVITFLQRDARVDQAEIYYAGSTDWYSAVGPQMKGIHVAARFGLERALQRLLSLPGGPTPDARGRLGLTPLICAAESGQQGVVTLLLATGAADVAAYDCDKRTALHCAAQEGHEVIVQALVATGKADVNGVDSWGYTALGAAAKRGHEGVVRTLLATANVDVDGRGCLDPGTHNHWIRLKGTGLESTPLYCAARDGMRAS